MKNKTKKILLMIVTVLVAIIAGGSFYVYTWLKNSVPITNGTVKLEGIDKNIEISFDKMGIGQIWAETEHDGYFALGYLHAADRMFQMDMTRRMAQGRLSELLGQITLESDRRQRQIGHNRIAREAAERLSSVDREKLQAYADGVNAYMKVSGASPFEYLLLGADFEEWIVYDCLSVLSFQSWYSDALQNHDQFFLKLREAMGDEAAQSLCFIYPDWAPVTIPKSDKLGFYQSDAIPKHVTNNLTQKNYSFSEKLTPYLMSNSSNAWVVGPSKSKSGSAMLASDPHLQITQLPQFWYMAGLHIKEININVLGITTPGLPYVIMGHNGLAAWAFTAGGIDITDYYMEKKNPEDSMQYLGAEGWQNFEIVTDSIIVAGLDTPVIITTLLTVRGPVLDEISGETEIYSFRWAGYDTDLALACGSGFALHQVDNFGDFRKIVTTLGALDASWLYADRDGNIGYQLGTPLPVRAEKSNCIPLPGWSSDFDWQGYCALEKTPHSFNPAQNWLANCNNLPTKERSFPELSGSFAPGRILRITKLMKEQNILSVAELQKFQMDRTDDNLLRWKDEITELLNDINRPDLAEIMKQWNGETDVNSVETAIAVEFLTQLKKLTFEDELGELYSGIRSFWIGEVYYTDELQNWFDDFQSKDQTESRDDIAAAAITRAVEVIDNKTWGEMNSLTMRHPMSTIPLLGGLLELNKGSLPWPGTASTLNASYIVPDAEGHYKTVVGPSWRFVIDFADVDAATFVLPAGNSGNPMSEHFFDFNDMWQSGKRWNVPITYERVKERTTATLILQVEEEIGQN